MNTMRHPSAAQLAAILSDAKASHTLAEAHLPEGHKWEDYYARYILFRLSEDFWSDDSREWSRWLGENYRADGDPATTGRTLDGGSGQSGT